MEGGVAEAIGEGLPVRGQFFDAFGFGSGEIILFGAVGLEVVEGPGFGLVVGDDFPVALAEGAVVFVEEPEGVVDDGGV